MLPWSAWAPPWVTCMPLHVVQQRCDERMLGAKWQVQQPLLGAAHTCGLSTFCGFSRYALHTSVPMCCGHAACCRPGTAAAAAAGRHAVVSTNAAVPAYRLCVLTMPAAAPMGKQSERAMGVRSPAAPASPILVPNAVIDACELTLTGLHALITAFFARSLA